MSSARRQGSTTSLSRFERADSPSLQNRNLDFCNAFWGQNDIGVEVLFARLRGASRTTEELKNFWKERSAIEEDYAKRLSKLAKSSLGRDEVGELRASLEVIRAETDRMASFHLTLAQQIRNDLESSVSNFAARQAQHRKQYQSGIEKEWKSKQLHEGYVHKAREKYESDCMRINSFTAQSSLVQGKDLERIHQKLKQAQQTVQTNERDFANFAKALGEITVRWEKDWKVFCDTCQDLEEIRIDFMKNNLWSFANSVSTVCVADDESCEKIRLALEQVEPEREVENFVRGYGTGNQIPDPPGFVDYNSPDAIASSRPTSRTANFIRSTQREPPLRMPPPPMDDDLSINAAGVGAGGGGTAVRRGNSQHAANGMPSPSRQQPPQGKSGSGALARQPSQMNGYVNGTSSMPQNSYNNVGPSSPTGASSSLTRRQTSIQPAANRNSYRGAPDPYAEQIDSNAETYIKIGNNAYKVDLSKDPQPQGQLARAHTTVGSGVLSGPPRGGGGAPQAPVNTGPVDPLAKQLEELKNVVSSVGTIRRNTISARNSQMSQAGASSGTGPGGSGAGTGSNINGGNGVAAPSSDPRSSQVLQPARRSPPSAMVNPPLSPAVVSSPVRGPSASEQQQAPPSPPSSATNRNSALSPAAMGVPTRKSPAPSEWRQQEVPPPSPQQQQPQPPPVQSPPGPPRDYRSSAELVVGAHPSVSRPPSPQPPTAAFMVAPKATPAGSDVVENVLSDYHQSLPGERKSIGSRRNSMVGAPPPQGAAITPANGHTHSQSLSVSPGQNGAPRPLSQVGHAGIGAHGGLSRSPSPQPLSAGPPPPSRPSTATGHHPPPAAAPPPVSRGPSPAPGSLVSRNSYMAPPQHLPIRAPSPNHLGIALDPSGRVVQDEIGGRYQQQPPPHPQHSLSIRRGHSPAPQAIAQPPPQQQPPLTAPPPVQPQHQQQGFTTINRRQSYMAPGSVAAAIAAPPASYIPSSGSVIAAPPPPPQLQPQQHPPPPAPVPASLTYQPAAPAPAPVPAPSMAPPPPQVVPQHTGYAVPPSQSQYYQPAPQQAPPPQQQPPPLQNPYGSVNGLHRAMSTTGSYYYGNAAPPVQAAPPAPPPVAAPVQYAPPPPAPAPQQYPQHTQQHPQQQQQQQHPQRGLQLNGYYGNEHLTRTPSPQPPMHQQQMHQMPGHHPQMQRGVQHMPQSSVVNQGGPVATTDDGSRILFYVRALYDYQATIEEEFDFQAGDVIAVTATPEDGWWSGQLLDEDRRQPGRHVFPSNFVCLF